MKPFYDHKYFYDRGCILDRVYILDREPFYDRGFSKKPFIIMIHEREPFLFFTAAQNPPGGLSYLCIIIWLTHSVQNTTQEITASWHW
jgi:hypothetical protein